MHPEPADIHSESFLHRLLRRQFRLSAFCAAAFLLVLFGLPLLNFWWPDLMSTRVFGFTLSWLILGVGLFPVVWLIAWLFIRQSTRLENEAIDSVRGTAGTKAAAGQVTPKP